MGNLDGKSAIVTGAGRGIGKAVAKLLAAEGTAVIVSDIGAGLAGEGSDESIAQQVVNEISAAGGTALANTDSITDYEAAQAMVQQAIDNFGKLDIVINVAGILRDRMIFNMSEEEWDAVIDVHLKGTFNICKWAAVHFRDRREGGRFVNFSSSSAWGSAGQPNYAAAKYGVLGLTATLANSMNRYGGVTANAILPYAATRMIDSTPRAQAIKEETGRLPSELAEEDDTDPGNPANVAPFVAYLCTDAAANINGHFFSVRGYDVAIHSSWELGDVYKADRRWTPQELARYMPEFSGDRFVPPVHGTPDKLTRPQSVTQQLQEAGGWESIAEGVELWTRDLYYDAKG
jgi:NAD(P)-dependent dehydrogenase (short-subunit alcohol dehydrogenase family)